MPSIGDCTEMASVSIICTVSVVPLAKWKTKSLALPLDTSPLVFILTVSRNVTYLCNSARTAESLHCACVNSSRRVSIPDPPVYRSVAPVFSDRL